MSMLMKNIVHYFVGGVTSKIIHIGVFLWLANQIGPAHFGEFSVFVSSVTIFTLIISFNLHGGISRYFYEEKSEEKSFLNTICLAIVFLFISWLAALYAFEVVFFKILSTNYIISTSLVIFSEIVASAYIQVTQSKKQSHKVAIFQILRFSSMGIAIYISLQFRSADQLSNIILHYSMGIFVPSLAIFTTYLIRCSKIKPKLKHLIYSIRYSVPMGIYLLSSFLLLHSDRVMISQIISYKAAGIYGYASTLAMGILLIINAVMAAWTPYYFELMNAKRYNDIRLQSERILVLCGGAGLFISCLFSATFQFVLPSEYLTSIPLFCMMVLVYYLSVAWQVYGRHLGFFKLTRIVAFIGFFTCFLNIFLNWFLIHAYGPIGAILATALSYLFMIIAGYYQTKKLLNLVIVKISFMTKILTYFVTFISMKFALESTLGAGAIVYVTLMNFVLIALYYWFLCDHKWIFNKLSKFIRKGVN